LGSLTLDLLDDVESLNNLSENDVLAIEPRGDDGGDEELGSVGVRSSVGHREKSGLGVLELEVLVSELLTVDGLSSGTVTLGEVTSLEHEFRDNSVEGRSSVSETVLSSAELTEVTSGLGDNIVVKLEDDTAHRGSVLGDIEVNCKREALPALVSEVSNGLYSLKRMRYKLSCEVKFSNV